MSDIAIVSCCLVFTLKYHQDGSVDRYKARIVAKSYTQIYGINYFETFLPVARMNSIKILFSIVVNLSWSLFQLDVNNAFLYVDLQEEVYIEQPPGYVAQGGIKVCPRVWFEKFNLTISVIGFHWCHSNHSVFFGVQSLAS